MGKYKVELLPAAWDDLQEIFDYIFLDNPKVAENVIDTIIKSLRILEDFPNAGSYPSDIELKRHGFKMVVCPPYISFYRVIEDTALVYHIVHGKRSYSNLFKTNMI